MNGITLRAVVCDVAVNSFWYIQKRLCLAFQISTNYSEVFQEQVYPIEGRLVFRTCACCGCMLSPYNIATNRFFAAMMRDIIHYFHNIRRTIPTTEFRISKQVDLRTKKKNTRRLLCYFLVSEIESEKANQGW